MKNAVGTLMYIAFSLLWVVWTSKQLTSSNYAFCVKQETDQHTINSCRFSPMKKSKAVSGIQGQAVLDGVLRKGLSEEVR